MSQSSATTLPAGTPIQGSPAPRDALRALSPEVQKRWVVTKKIWNNPGLCSKAVSSGGVRRLWATGSSPPPGQGFAARTVRGCLPASLHGKVLVMGRDAAGTRHRRQSVPEGQRHRAITEPWTRPAPIPCVEEQRQPGTGRRAGQSPTSS